MVQIIKGSYGMRVGKTIKPVSANDGPVELPKEEEERLGFQYPLQGHNHNGLKTFH